MQDRFKFRVWNKKVKKMYDVKSMSYIDGVIKRIEVQGDIGIATFDEYRKHIDNCILMQCTGLKDKNGKLIYEGDILNYSCLSGYSDIYACTFNNGIFLIGGLLISNTHLKSEVIGNIYENKELLESKEK